MQRDDPAFAHNGSSSREPGGDLGRVLRIVVVHAHASLNPAQFETARGTREAPDRAQCGLSVYPTFSSTATAPAALIALSAPGTANAPRTHPLVDEREGNSTSVTILSIRTSASDAVPERQGRPVASALRQHGARRHRRT